MSLIKKKLDELDITWKIGFRKTLLVFGCYFGALTICFIIVMGLGIISFSLFPQEVSSTFFNDTIIRFFVHIVPFFGCLIGLFKALLDILSLKEEDLSPS